MCIWYISLKWTVALTEWSFRERLLGSFNRRKTNTVSISNRSWLTRLWLNPVENSNANTHRYLLCCPNWGWWKLSAGLARCSASLAPLWKAEHLHTRMCASTYARTAGCWGDKLRERSAISWPQLPPWGGWRNTLLRWEASTCPRGREWDHPLSVCLV